MIGTDCKGPDFRLLPLSRKFSFHSEAGTILIRTLSNQLQPTNGSGRR